jgi:catechol 2,3-dioxygenase-like lactoylglutathione lyase family enzyme
MAGFDHSGIRVASHDASTAFYDAALAPLGMTRLYDQSFPDGKVSGYGEGRAIFFVASGGAPSRRLHLAFLAPTRDAVHAFHAAALAAGGTDNGQPGLRPHLHEAYYAAFVLDPDGHNIEAVTHVPE